MQSYYEINVSLNGRHFFATAPRSGIDKQSVAILFASIVEKFPESEGYKITCTYWAGSGHVCDPRDN